MPSQAQWSKLNEYLTQVGQLDDAIALCVNALNQLGKLVSFDQGRVYFMDQRGKVYDEYLLNVSKKVTKDYHGYYSQTDDGQYSVSNRVRAIEEAHATANPEDELPKGSRVSFQTIRVIDWETEQHDTKFYREHVAPQGLTSSTGFSLHDNGGKVRALFCLDRTRSVGFSRDDAVLLGLVATHLDNLFRKFYAKPPAVQGDQIGMLTGEVPLTERERQVCTLLMRGSSPKAIASILGIAVRTVYKHMDNTYKKVGVSSQLELIAKLSE